MIFHWDTGHTFGAGNNVVQWQALYDVLTPEEWAAYNMFIVF